MTVTEVSTNGDRKAAAAEILAAEPGISMGDLGYRIGVGERQARNIRNAVRGAGGRSVASGAVPVVVTDGVREVPPPARTNKPTRGPKPWWQRRDPVRLVAAAIVTAVVAAVSYSHIIELALLAGAGWPAYVLPLALDGMVFVAVRCLVVDGLRDPVAWLAALLGFAGSAAANVFRYRPDLIDLDQAIIVIGLSFAVSLILTGWLLERGTT